MILISILPLGTPYNSHAFVIAMLNMLNARLLPLKMGTDHKKAPSGYFYGL